MCTCEPRCVCAGGSSECAHVSLDVCGEGSSECVHVSVCVEGVVVCVPHMSLDVWRPEFWLFSSVTLHLMF